MTNAETALYRARLWLLYHLPIMKEERFLGATLLRIRAWLYTPLYLLLHPSRRNLEKVRLCHRLTPRYTMVSPRLLFAVYDLVEQTMRSGVPGGVVECGVWNGGSAAMMAVAVDHAGQERDFWLFDSFQGLPEPSESDPSAVRDFYFEGWNTGSPERVKSAWKMVGAPPSRLHIRAGWFDQTFPREQLGDKIAVLHIDSDWYESVKLCLEAWYDQVSAGGVVIFNDYNQWRGTNKAVDEFFEERRVDVDLVPLGPIGAYFVKPEPAG